MVISQPKIPPEHAIATLDTGDTFYVDLIHSLVNHTELQFSLTYAYRLAGHKFGHVGFDHLTQIFEASFLCLKGIHIECSSHGASFTVQDGH